MKQPANPDAPHVRLAMLLLLEATKAGANELRLATGENEMEITLDGKSQPAPTSELYRPLVQAILEFAGIRIRPWSKTISKKQLNFRLQEQQSRWNIASQNPDRELILKRVYPKDQTN